MKGTLDLRLCLSASSGTHLSKLLKLSVLCYLSALYKIEIMAWSNMQIHQEENEINGVFSTGAGVQYVLIILYR